MTASPLVSVVIPVYNVEAYLPRAVLPAEGLELYLGVVPAGYLWVFPHSDRVCVGLINQQHEEAFPYRQTLELFLLDQGVPTGDLQYKGAFVPYGKPVSQAKTPDNVLLVGDAGGFVDPIYGEGLYLALLSGMTAGRALSAQAPKQAFLKNMQPAIRMIQSGSRLQSILFVPAVQKRLMGKIQGRNRFLKYYCDHQVSDYQYKHTDVRIVRDYKKSR